MCLWRQPTSGPTAHDLCGVRRRLHRAMLRSIRGWRRRGITNNREDKCCNRCQVSRNGPDEAQMCRRNRHEWCNFVFATTTCSQKAPRSPKRAGIISKAAVWDTKGWNARPKAESGVGFVECCKLPSARGSGQSSDRNRILEHSERRKCVRRQKISWTQGEFFPLSQLGRTLRPLPPYIDAPGSDYL